MDKIAIISPLKPEEWMASWEDKVVDEKGKKDNNHRVNDYFAGVINNDGKFVLGYYKAFKAKSLSMDEYFFGELEENERGCRVVGGYYKKKSVRLYLTMGMLMFLILGIISLVAGQNEVLMMSVCLFLIFLLMYKGSSEEERKILREHLIKISTDERFKGKKRKRNKQKSISEIAKKG